LTAGVLDYEAETSPDAVLAGMDLPARGGAAEVIDLTVHGVRVTLCPRPPAGERSPDPRASAVLLDPAERMLERFRPEVLLTYGGGEGNGKDRCREPFC
jgi:hypothetical protein